MMPNTVIIHGPQGCGKTTNKDALAKHFNCPLVVDNWIPKAGKIIAGALHLTCYPISGEVVRQSDNMRAQIIDYELAMLQIGDAVSAVKARLLTQYNRHGDGKDISHLSEKQRANLWVVEGNVGMSSKRIWSHMTGTVTNGNTSDYPYDPDDLNRCLLLLEAVPEWKARMGEMAAHGPVWAALAARWDEITQSFLDEVGLNWTKAESAGETYNLMKQVRESAKAGS